MTEEQALLAISKKVEGMGAEDREKFYRLLLIELRAALA